MTLFQFRTSRGRNILSAAIYCGTLFLWWGQSHTSHLNLYRPAPSQLGAGRWAW